MYKKNIIYYIINILILLIMLLVPINVYANNEEKVIRIAATGDLGDLDQFKGTATSSTQLNNMAGNVLGAIQMVGTVVSVIVLIIIGIKYMLGSVEEKAEYKQRLIPYLIGAVLLFAGTLIPELIYELVQGLE